MRIAEKLKIADGRPSGFDYLRLSLALGVFLLHGLEGSYGRTAQQFFWETPVMPFSKALVPAFFALSGFLVAGSLERTRTLFMFVGLRAIRIYPALIVDIGLSALVLGACVTTLPIQEYYTHPQFFRYLANISGEISYKLPGVFDGAAVNQQLWTVPFELYCYISLAALVILGIRTRRAAIFYFILVSIVVALAYAVFKHGDKFYIITQSVPGFTLLTAFGTGVGLYLYRDTARWSRTLALVSGVIAYLALLFVPGSDFLAVVPLSYLTIYLGLYNPPRISLIKSADYSYGIYLYHLPIQQTLIHFAPYLYPWYFAIPIELALTALFAAFSWYCIEKPALELRTHLRVLEERFFPKANRQPLTDPVHSASANMTKELGDVSAHRPPSREILPS